MLRASIVAATALLAACPSSTQTPRPPDDRPLRIQVAQAEARRGGGIAELRDLVTHGDGHARELAVRGLGRIGGPQALDALVAALADGDPHVAAAAIDAIGIAAALDEPEPAAQKTLAEALLARAAIDPALVATAVGRTGGAAQQAALLALGDRAPEAVAFALGRMGRRKIALTAEARAWLSIHSTISDRRASYATMYALSREHQPPQDPAANAALALGVADEAPEVRATAIAGLARRDAITTSRPLIEAALLDRDWRVAVEAVRALAGEHGDDAGRDAVAAALTRRFAALVAGDPVEAQVVIEGLRALQAYGARPTVAAALAPLTGPADPRVSPLARGWIACLATVALVRAQAQPDLAQITSCGGDAMPDHLRLPLLADFVTAGAGDPATRRAALRMLLDNADARVRAAGLGAVAASKDLDEATIISTIASALGANDPIVAGAASDAATTAYDKIAGPKPALDAAVIARAIREQEPELSAALYELIGKRSLAAGADACRAGLAASPVRAHAAAECLRALGEAAPAPAIGAAQPPPVDVTAVIGRDVRWHLQTSRGEIVIQLRPDLAPWNVATIAALTDKHFYDGLELHRVVPDFVVQGGDPTQSGWGGPGFTTPAEPSDGGFVTGGVGIADAGRDSGGSQWFVMHSAAPHLDGRYTYIGAVVSGQKSADALLIGDRVEHATIEAK